MGVGCASAAVAAATAAAAAMQQRQCPWPTIDIFDDCNKKSLRSFRNAFFLNRTQKKDEEYFFCDM